MRRKGAILFSPWCLCNRRVFFFSTLLTVASLCCASGACCCCLLFLQEFNRSMALTPVVPKPRDLAALTLLLAGPTVGFLLGFSALGYGIPVHRALAAREAYGSYCFGAAFLVCASLYLLDAEYWYGVGCYKHPCVSAPRGGYASRQCTRGRARQTHGLWLVRRRTRARCALARCALAAWQPPLAVCAGTGRSTEPSGAPAPACSATNPSTSSGEPV